MIRSTHLVTLRAEGPCQSPLFPGKTCRVFRVKSTSRTWLIEPSFVVLGAQSKDCWTASTNARSSAGSASQVRPVDARARLAPHRTLCKGLVRACSTWNGGGKVAEFAAGGVKVDMGPAGVPASEALVRTDGRLQR